MKKKEERQLRRAIFLMKVELDVFIFLIIFEYILIIWEFIRLILCNISFIETTLYFINLVIFYEFKNELLKEVKYIKNNTTENRKIEEFNLKELNQELERALEIKENVVILKGYKLFLKKLIKSLKTLKEQKIK